MPDDPHTPPPQKLTDWLRWNDEYCAVCGKLIAAEKRADAALNRLRIMMNRAPIGVMVIDEKLSILWVNSYLLDRLHCGLRDLAGMSLHSITPVERYDYRVMLFQKQAHDEGVSRSGFLMYLRDCIDLKRYIEFNVEIVPLLKDPFIHAFIVYMNATAP